MSDLERITYGEFIGFNHPKLIINVDERLKQISGAITSWYNDVKTLYGYRSKEKIFTCKLFRYWQNEAMCIGYKLDISDINNTIKITPL